MVTSPMFLVRNFQVVVLALGKRYPVSHLVIREVISEVRVVD